MASLYAQYIAEREGKHIVEDERGFAAYSYMFDLKIVYIEDIYVQPAFRKQNVASEYADKIIAEAKTKGIKRVIGSVSPKANSATASMKVLLAYGFEVDSMDANLIYFKKQIDT